VRPTTVDDYYVDQPHLYFMHFWANDDARKLAEGLKAALAHINIAKSVCVGGCVGGKHDVVARHRDGTDGRRPLRARDEDPARRG
jgi:hypothetical protein